MEAVSNSTPTSAQVGSNALDVSSLHQPYPTLAEHSSEVALMEPCPPDYYDGNGNAEAVNIDVNCPYHPVEPQGNIEMFYLQGTLNFFPEGDTLFLSRYFLSTLFICPALA